jgi:TolB protein
LFIVACSNDNEPQDNTNREDAAAMLDIPLSGSLQNPAFSPDGKAIVFTRFINGYNKEPAELYIYNLETRQLRLLVGDGSGNINLPGSCWVDDKIVFASTREPHDEIYIINAAGKPGDEIKITARADSVAYEPSFSPDADWIVFESHKIDEEGEGIICKYKTDGNSSYIYLTNNGDDCRQPNWASAADIILYQKYENNQWDIWTVSTNGSNSKKITKGQGNKTDASFSSDGKYIYYSADAGLNYANIFKVEVSTGNAYRITDFEGYDGAPSVSPDGEKIAFESCKGDPDESAGTKLFLLTIAK